MRRRDKAPRDKAVGSDAWSSVPVRVRRKAGDGMSDALASGPARRSRRRSVLLVRLGLGPRAPVAICVRARASGASGSRLHGARVVSSADAANLVAD